MVEQKRKRILLITRNLPPLVGGMERLNWHMVDELARRAEVRVVGPAGAEAEMPHDVIVREVEIRPLSGFLLRAAYRAVVEARSWRPDVVIAGSGLTAPIAWLAAAACKTRAMTYVHGLDIALQNRIYRWLWLPFLRRMVKVVANSRATVRLAEAAGVPLSKIEVVHPGVTLPSAPLDDHARPSWRDSEALVGSPILLSVGRLSERKGLREFVRNALPRIVRAFPDAVLVIVGDAPKDALYARAQSAESIREVAEGVGVGSNLRFLGAVADHELDSIYSAANVHVFPVRDITGDPEGFGMVAIEAAAHGVPTVAFASGGVEDAVSNEQSGFLVPPGNYEQFADAVIRLLASERGMDASCREFATRFAWPQFGRKFAAQLGIPDCEAGQ